jgi:uncharacterized RDD family membrane protein YckC
MSQTIRYAGFWRRFGAFMLDYILFSSVLFLINYCLYGSDYLRWSMNPEHGSTEALLNYILWPVVTIIFWIKMAATPGKSLLSCKVVDADTGKPMRAGQAVLRCFGYLISVIPMGFGFVYAAWDPRKQALHDKIARTIVVVEDEADQLLQEWRGQQ